MNRRAVLSCWQDRWEPLSEPLRGRFLARLEVEELSTMADETARMAIWAHPKLHDEIAHARWLVDGRRSAAACGCETEEREERRWVGHRLSIVPGPDTRLGLSGPRSSTFAAYCSCGWEKRGGSEGLLRTLWDWHVRGDEEEPFVDE